MTSEFVRFEVADVAASARLAARLADRWNVVMLMGEPHLVGVLAELRPAADDVAALLRDVEAWVEEESLCAIRYELDGRGYVLEAGELDWSLDTADVVADDAVGRRARLLDALDSLDQALSVAEEPSQARVRGLEGLRDDIVFALRMEDTSS